MNGCEAKRKEVLQNVFSDRAFIESMIRLTNSAADYNVLNQLGDIRVQKLVCCFVQ